MQQRVGPRNAERFRAAKMIRPDLTFDAWIDTLWRIAVGGDTNATADAQGVTPPAKTKQFHSNVMTGSFLRPALLRILDDATGDRMARSQVIGKLEDALRGQFTKADYIKTSAGIASWKHRLLSEVAQLRKRGLMEKAVKGESLWAISPKGVHFARSLQTP